MIKRSIALIASLIFIYFVWKYGEQERDLVVAFVGAIIGGMFTLIGVNISLKQTRAMNYGRFYLHFNKAQIHINRFIRKSKKLSEKLGGIERSQVRSMFIGYEFVELKKDIEYTIIALNKEINSVDLDSFSDDLLDINENAPIEYYYDMNFIIYTMISIYNSLVLDGKYLIQNLPEPISFNSLRIIKMNAPHHKQISLLEKRYKKIKRKMKLK